MTNEIKQAFNDNNSEQVAAAPKNPYVDYNLVEKVMAKVKTIANGTDKSRSSMDYDYPRWQ